MIKSAQAKKISGTIIPPPDKSISHRALFFSSVAWGKSKLKNLANSRAITATKNILKCLGVEIEEYPNEVRVKGRYNKGFKEPSVILDALNSATTARLALGLLAGQKFTSTLTGSNELQTRPMQRITVPLKTMGAQFLGRDDYLPLTIQGGNLQGIEYTLPIPSAQIKSSILLAGLFAEGITKIKEVLPTRDHSERLLYAMTGNIWLEDGFINLTESPLANIKFTIPGDFSAAAFFITLAILHPSANLKINKVNLNPTRTMLLDLLESMGAQFYWESKQQEIEPVGWIEAKSSKLKGIKIDPKIIPYLIDELPLLALIGTQAHGVTEVRGASELRFKESDRIKSTVLELQKLGANIEELPDGFMVEGPTPLKGTKLEAHNDHRIAMMLAVAASIAEGESLLTGEHWVKESYPNFFLDLKSVTK